MSQVETKENAIETFRALLADVDKLERKWLALTEEQRRAAPETIRKFFAEGLKQ
jgi:hypothetical protein